MLPSFFLQRARYINLESSASATRPGNARLTITPPPVSVPPLHPSCNLIVATGGLGSDQFFTGLRETGVRVDFSTLP